MQRSAIALEVFRKSLVGFRGGLSGGVFEVVEVLAGVRGDIEVFVAVL